MQAGRFAAGAGDVLGVTTAVLARAVGAELEANPGIDGMVFTGSYEVGMQIVRAGAAQG